MVVLTGCGPQAGGEVETTTDPSSTSGGTSTSDETTSVPTTGEPPPVCPPCGPEQVHEGELNLDSDADAAGLGCIVRVTGPVRIGEKLTARGLAALAGLRTINSSLLIADNELLTDLAPLACLRETTGVTLVRTPALTDLTALAGLTKLEQFTLSTTGVTALPAITAKALGLVRLDLSDSPALVDLDAMAGWTVAAEGLRMNIADAPSLVSIAGLPALPDGSQIEIQNAPKLASLAGLESLRVASMLWLDRVPAVADLEPLAGLEGVGWLVLNDMPKVTTLAPLAKLVDVSGLVLGACYHGGPDLGGMAGLTSLAGLDALTRAPILGIANSPGLVSLAGAPNLSTVEQLQVVGNAGLAQADFDELLAGLGAPPEEACFGTWDTCTCFNFESP